MDERTRSFVRKRAGDRCEYCRLRQVHSPLARLHVEHVIPQKHGGDDDAENLALACMDCNLHKGTNLAGIDPLTGALTRIFNPRVDRWAEHFEWRGESLDGKTPIGRTTVRVLEMNSPDRIEHRSEIGTD